MGYLVSCTGLSSRHFIIEQAHSGRALYNHRRSYTQKIQEGQEATNKVVLSGLERTAHITSIFDLTNEILLGALK